MNKYGSSKNPEYLQKQIDTLEKHINEFGWMKNCDVAGLYKQIDKLRTRMLVLKGGKIITTATGEKFVEMPGEQAIVF